MKTKIFGCSILLLYLFSLTAGVAQDLGAQFKKVEGRHLRLRRGAQRSQCHDRFEPRRRRVDRHGTESERFPRGDGGCEETDIPPAGALHHPS